MHSTNHPPKALKGAILSITTYLILSVLKVVFGYIYNSEAVLADGFNNTTDVIASIAVYIGIRVAATPRDAEHKYGHAKMETIAALVASLIMVAVGVFVLLNSIANLLAGVYVEPNPLAAVVAFFSAIVMYGVHRYNLNLAKQTKSLALKAAAKDNLADALISIGATLGVLFAYFKLPWMDTMLAVVIAGLIIRTAIQIFLDATHQLSDGFPPDLVESYEETIQHFDTVKEVREIKGRHLGNHVMLDVTIAVDGALTVDEAHTLCDDIERELDKHHAVDSVHIHIEPV
ncbi:cation transporter [Exiguobacterium sp. SH3S2]|uniref:cation diffusion facilitator family transporter n=1 Tax=unclassified Exiguobacterium TaxID=2644629 RepID=UPI00103F6B84|nr:MULTISPECIES: cation diffusion facilitator family transporter [unclassified Exiguobacterium]TCI45700.1 cation transporter [Exiguobacterium sp. SH3S3]TCI60144.1 cation transporter [Exiguobacterium sp. SH3S1]TCI60909.1 cation transporter [Exiguobacterium sp. SH3S2]